MRLSEEQIKQMVEDMKKQPAMLVTDIEYLNLSGEKQGILDIIDIYIEGYEEFKNPVIAVESVIKDLKTLRKVVAK